MVSPLYVPNIRNVLSRVKGPDHLFSTPSKVFTIGPASVISLVKIRAKVVSLAANGERNYAAEIVIDWRNEMA